MLQKNSVIYMSQVVNKNAIFTVPLTNIIYIYICKAL